MLEFSDLSAEHIILYHNAFDLSSIFFKKLYFSVKKIIASLIPAVTCPV